MKLVSVEADHFKNILKSGIVTIQPDVTCVVGKNESGKTAFLQALHRFHPAQPNVTFNAQRQYPAWLEKQHRRQKDINQHCPITCTFELEKHDLEAIEQVLGSGVLKKSTIPISRTYSDHFRWTVEINEPAVVTHIARGLLGSTPTPTSIDELNGLINTLGNSTHTDEAKIAADRSLASEITQARDQALGKCTSVNDRLWELLQPRLPKFFYFDDYSQLPASVNIRELLAKKKEELAPGELTARSLLELGGADNEYLLNPDYETRKRELENIANAITHQVLTFWSTNPELRTDVDMTLKQTQTANGQQTVLDELKIRLYDNRHLLSLSFDERSTGFRWFFSFLAAFSEYESSDSPVVILLDEPGLGLHARAQADFLRFIDDRLSKRCPVIYTTHSPFMVQPGKLERVRLVQDGGREVGSRITANVLSTDRDTLFPLQGALGYDMVQHLFIAPHNLIVEGTSDFTYLNLLSTHLGSTGRTGLDPKWSIIPVGGADLIPSFVALLGNHLDLTVLIDARKEGNQRLQNLTQQGLLKGARLITIGEITGTKVADIEDLFTPDEYLRLFNEAFSSSFKVTDLVGKDPIVNRLARVSKVERYDHGLPATVLLKNYPSFLPTLSPETLTRFETLFQRINTTLGT
ncbi:AAA family ATPase [Bradyrhizobium sp. CB3481]|uniref:ATP-dependent nuclease n=1 Tax=Bradyrhizobium sp. CB3481 TaxID=3039158 RepID=UPI0024B18884|nr:AAA family ATPase [Bradyrhizobium sp. CB3481]WFU19425.1 AAA family ATPase [Bradyrhizobium sp. CB3481]